MTHQKELYGKMLKEALDDEAKAGNVYRNMAGIAPTEEDRNALRAIAADEDRHYSILSHLSTVASMTGEQRAEYTERMGYALGYVHPSQVGRPFPKTYGDWVNLAEDIKEVEPNISWEVNTRLGHIASESEEAEGSKRWLVQKAGELGIG